MLKRIMPHELGTEDIDYYYQALATDEHSGGVDLVSKAIYDEHLQLWRWKTNACLMVVVTQILHKPDGFSELLISMLAGTGGIHDWDEITTAFAEDPCREFYCDRVIAYVKADSWEIFKNAGAGKGAEELFMVIGKEPNGREDV